MADLFGLYDTTIHRSSSQDAAWARLAAAVGVAAATPETTAPVAAAASLTLWARFAERWGSRAAPDAKGRSHGRRGRLMVFGESSRDTAGRAKPSPEESSQAVSADGRITVAMVAASRDDCRAAEILDALNGTDPTAFHNLESQLSTSGPGSAAVCAIYDRNSDTMTCVRGFDGPPLFHFVSKGIVWFGTHLPILRRLPEFPVGINYDAVAFFLAFGFPPLDRTFFRSVSRLKPGGILRITQDGVKVMLPDSPALGLRRSVDLPIDSISEPVEVLRETVSATISCVAGRRVAILGKSEDPRNALLVTAAERAGATEVLLLAEETVPLSFEDALKSARRVIASEGDVFAAPALVALAGLARQAVGQADICLCSDGSTTLLPGARRHRRFADKVLQASAARRLAEHGQAFHAGKPFIRDLYFDELALFDDRARLAISGPMLAQWNIFSMADELGSLLETATPNTAADLACGLDSALLATGAFIPLAGAVGREAGVPVLAPYVAKAVQSRIRAMSERERVVLGGMPDTWLLDEPASSSLIDQLVSGNEGLVRETLSSPTFVGRGLFGRLAVNELLELHFNDSVPAGSQIWALCCLEAWFQEFVDYRR